MNHLVILSCLILFMFIVSGINKIRDFTNVAEGLQKRVKIDVPFVLYQFAILMALLLQIVGSSVIIYSAYTGEFEKYAYYSSIALAGFTILATLVYHYPPVGKNYYPVLSNITTFGALLLLATQFKEDKKLSLYY
jgi:uncharacterized membrane protein YphA (DoxX/SURF4 family)